MEEALKKYNAKWTGGNNEYTSRLYREATKGKTSHYGCNLQNHVLSLLGYDGLKQLKHISPNAQKWVDWMLS